MKLTMEEFELLMCFRSLEDTQKNVIQNYARGLAMRYQRKNFFPSPKTKTSSTPKVIPLRKKGR